MTKELIERLYASDVASALTNEAARAIEALQARVADQSAQLTRHTNLIDQLQEERCKLAAELAAARAVIKRVQHIALIDPPHTGQMLEIAAALATPIPPVREPLSDEEVDALGDL